jgi:hypothetical protein
MRGVPSFYPVRMPAMPVRSGKRPLWVTILMLLAAGGIWFAQHKGWLAKPAPQASGTQQTSQQTNQQSNQQASQPTSQQAQRAETPQASSNPARSLPEPKPQSQSQQAAQPRATEQASTPAAKPAPKPAARPEATKPAPQRPKGTVTAAEIDASNTANMTARERAERTPVSGDQLDELYKQEKNLVWVEGTGKVIKVLTDDTDGAKHQRFTMANDDGHEVMVAHNIDLSPRAPVKVGDTISYRGEYIWTDRGGKVHFTHKPQYGNFRGGWIEVGGKRYE